MIVEPPSSPGVKPIVAELEPAEALSDVGAAATVRGVVVTVADATASPIDDTARIRIEYGVPLVRPVTTSGLVVDTGLLDCHAPPFTWNW
jgi:hypothetical protein